MAYQGFDSLSVGRLFKTVLPDYIREVEQAHLRKRAFSALMDVKGKIKYNCGGNGFHWPVKSRYHQMRAYTGTQRRTFTSLDPFEHANLSFGGYEVTDAMNERERLLAANGGEATIINYYDDFLESLGTSINEQVGPQYFNDGSTAANSNFWHGLDTLFQGTQTINSALTTTTARTANAADIYYAPAGTYAALTQTLGNYGGAQEIGLNWPDGNADPEYDFWSSIHLNATSTSLNVGGSGNTFFDQGEEAIGLGISKILRNRNANGGLTHLFMGTSWFETYKRIQRNKQRIIVGADSELTNAGFRQNSFMTDDGVEIVNEYQIDPEEAYGVTFEEIELRCVFDSMFSPQGPFYDEEDDEHRVAIRNLSQLKFGSPRNFLKLTDTI